MLPSEIADSVVFVHSWPDHLVAPDLIFWLLKAGFRQERISFSRKYGRNICVAMNATIKQAALSGAPWAVFCDRDMRPTPRKMEPWLASSDYDVTCVKYPVETGEKAWSSEHSFHTGIWRARPSDLMKIKMPVYEWSTTEDGAELLGCNCRSAPDKFREAGLTVGVAGWCNHVPRGCDNLPDMMRFGG